MYRPTATLTIDGTAMTAPEAQLVALEVELGTDGAHDRVRAAVAPASPAAAAPVGAAITVALGYDGDEETLLTGTVARVARGSAGTVVEGLAGTAALSGTWIGRSYLSQTVADIVSDLVSAGGGTAGDIAAPLALAAYHVDERRPVWAHIRALATLAGAELSADGDGALNLRPAKAAGGLKLRHGADVLAWHLGPDDPRPWAGDVVPFGAASEEGSEKWHVLLKEPEGSSPSAPTLVPGALRDRDGAQAFKDALLAAADRRRLAGTMSLVGNARLRAGEVVELADMPSGENGAYRITAARHRLDHEGFRTHLRLGATA